jgi:hypothetical protein
MVLTEIVAKFGAKVLPFVEQVMLESQQISHNSFSLFLPENHDGHSCLEK